MSTTSPTTLSYTKPTLVKIVVVMQHTNLLARLHAPFVRQCMVLMTDVIGCNAQNAAIGFTKYAFFNDSM